MATQQALLSLGHQQQSPRAQADPIRAVHGMLGPCPLLGALLLCYCRALCCAGVRQQQLTT